MRVREEVEEMDRRRRELRRRGKSRGEASVLKKWTRKE